MTDAPDPRAALLSALRADPTLLPGVADRAGRATGAPPDERLDDDGRQQFLNAFDALLTEALEESGTETRTFIFETAIPAMVDQGIGALRLLESHVTFFVVLSGALAGAVPAAQREAAEEWLAAFFAGYVRELTEIAQRVEREARP